jgi:Tfp pilus assembly protein PilF
MNKQITASEMGKIGGAKKSLKKTLAARANAKKPRTRKIKSKIATQRICKNFIDNSEKSK